MLLARWNAARLSSNNKVFPEQLSLNFVRQSHRISRGKMLFLIFKGKSVVTQRLHCSYKTVSFDEVVYTIYLCNKNVVQQIIIICDVDNGAEKGKTV